MNARTDDIFPASIRLEGSPDIFGQIMENNYSVDLIGDSFVNLYVTEIEYIQLMQQFDDLVENGSISISIIQTRKEVKEVLNRKYGYGHLSYHSYEGMLAELRQLENQNPGICKLHDLGVVSDGVKKMWGFKISDNVNQEEDEPVAAVVGGVHGDETPGTEQVMYVINHIINNKTGPLISKLINNTQLWFIPMFNPAGRSLGIRGNAIGTDLNRNYPTPWSAEPGHALSEEETQNYVNNFFDKHDHIVATCDCHTGAVMYMYPYAHTSRPTADYKALKDLSDKMASSSGVSTSESLNTLWGVQLGGAGDYFYAAYGTFYIGVELVSPKGPDARELGGIVSMHLNAVMMLLNRVHHSTVTGRITYNGQPVVATVAVQGVDGPGNERKPYKSDATFGRYYRMLTPGTHNISFTYNGDVIVENNVSVVNTQQTILNIEFGEPDSDTDSETESGSDTDSDSGSDADSDSDTDGDSDSDSDGDLDTDGDSDSDSDGDTDGDSDSDSDRDSDNGVDSEGNQDNDSDSDSDLDGGSRNHYRSDGGCGCSLIGRSFNSTSVLELILFNLIR
ncbi:MAG: hypothetical protein GY847_10465 [Proteobacteria bacterium]|nr:hypothetical protein [Pseudomonadota bacterium]